MASLSLTAPLRVYPVLHSKLFPLTVSKLTISSFNLSFTPPPPSSSLSVTAARHRHSSSASVSSKTTKKKKATEKNAQEDEDAFEALFSQLEEDLKNDALYGDENEDDDDISDEELAKLEQELAEALEDDDILFGDLVSATHREPNDEDDDIIDGEGGYGDDNENEGEEKPIKLKNWQLRRLAYALKDGRRKTRIKNLAADLCLDREVVLRLLRDPPPNLVMLSATLPDKPVSTIVDPVQKMESIPLDRETETVTEKPETKAKIPVHVMLSNWSAQKRLKKVQLQTLEQVYARTKRPTNAMISSIVHVTNLPRKRVVKWFEDRRGEDGVPERRLPYQGSIDQPIVSG